ncbi:DUF2213 domain-containing protein [Rhizorhabdus wittichii]|uniref:DUF2213 domain-containing protein n=1 Tax=Rhizorhabdus wittichii TaxID=160791 RepID=A0A975D075_9SPHN|nr:DUF2213 domain-containing protein [Rhizorhabdus wittichii]QTH19781.1 DUF2213 domain-containing protein [Rhizorhabdus wittichii]
MLFTDRAILDGPARITREGHLLAVARAARANNVQDYLPHEIGQAPKPDGTPYRIFRPEAEVFARDAVQSAAHRPITVDHPAEDVSATNWKRLAVGDTGGEVLRDGEFLRLPIMVMDADGVQAATTTHQEFSLGYKADLDMTPGTFGDQSYDGVMRNIRINHLALCRHARGGAELRIVDERTSPNGEMKMSKIKIGDSEVDLSDGAAVAVAVGALQSKLTDAEGKVGTLTAENANFKTSIEAKDGEIAALKSQLADATDPAKVKARDEARAKVVDAAKKIAGDKLVIDGKSDAEIRRAAVEAKLGDAAKAMSDDAIAGAFAAYAPLGDAKPQVQPIGAPSSLGDAADVRNQARFSRYAS